MIITTDVFVSAYLQIINVIHFGGLAYIYILPNFGPFTPHSLPSPLILMFFSLQKICLFVSCHLSLISLLFIYIINLLRYVVLEAAGKDLRSLFMEIFSGADRSVLVLWGEEIKV